QSFYPAKLIARSSQSAQPACCSYSSACTMPGTPLPTSPSNSLQEQQDMNLARAIQFLRLHQPPSPDDIAAKSNAWAPCTRNRIHGAMVEPEFVHCGSTNTEPGAVATGFELGLE